MDNEALAQMMCATLRRTGHQVTVATTIAGTVETLMRRGPLIDVIITMTQPGSSLGEDVVHYGRKFAVNARFITLREVGAHADDIELVLARQSVPERLHAMHGWN